MIRFSIFDSFRDDMFHGFTTRLGGVSEPPYDSLNLGLKTADKPESIRRNYELLSSGNGFDFDDLTLSDQVHGTVLKYVTEEDRGKGISRKSDIISVDGMYTDVRGIALVTLYADCVPVFIYDPARKAIGLSHSGWRGTVAGIAGKTVRTMAEKLGCDPRDMVAAAGPAIGKCCYEVDKALHDIFAQELPRSERFFEEAPGEGKYMLDLRGIIGQDLADSGLKPENIHISDFCTCCRTDIFYSHRASGGITGRMAAVMKLL